MMKSSCNLLSVLPVFAYRSDKPATSLCGRSLPLLLALGLLSACGSGGDSSTGSLTSTANDNNSALSADLSGQLAATQPNRSNVMELTISGLGSNNPQTEVGWVSPDGSVSSAAPASDGGSSASSIKSTANAVPLPGFLDVAGVSTSTLDLNGVRYIATRVKVRNAPACGAPPVGGTCTPYATQRQNVTFFAVSTENPPGTPTSINQTAVSRFNRFDGSPANPLLTTSLLPVHGLSQSTQRVDPLLASLQVYNENELPPAEPTVSSVFPYGFVVRNVFTGSRILTANPPNNLYEGEVTFGLSIPLQPLPTDDPFKISLRFQTADDFNLRVTQGRGEQNFPGDVASTLRASSLSGSDLVVLGGRLAQTPIGNPICRVRTAGTASSPTAFLVNQIPATPEIRSAPMNLSFVERISDVSVGFCENMAAPTANSFVVNGSQSGRRVVGGAYGGTLTGGGISSQRNQLVWNINGQKPFFPGEEVSFTATSGNTNLGAVPITSFVGSFKVEGSQTPSLGVFAAPTNFAVGTNPWSVTLGDVNGDGRLDIVGANLASNSVSVLLGNGAGGFGAAVNFAVGTRPYSVTLGDVNGDGRLDIVAANFDSNNVSVLLGNGIGGFAAAVNFPVGTNPRSVALGDMNGDGRLDIVVSNFGSNSVSVLLGNGAGGLGAAVNFAVGTTPYSVTLGDVNGDGRLDLVTANGSSSNVSVLLGNGAGGFGAAVNFAVGASPFSVTLGDLNGDGRLDIVAANLGSDNVSVRLGNGAGGFGALVNFAVGTDPRSVTLGDVNGDGRLDIVVANGNSNNVSVLLGNGAGGFGAAVNFAVGASPTSVTLGDVNGDGQLDLVAANDGPNNVSVLFGF